MHKFNEEKSCFLAQFFVVVRFYIDIGTSILSVAIQIPFLMI
jgi:hypothetical protein